MMQHRTSSVSASGPGPRSTRTPQPQLRRPTSSKVRRRASADEATAAAAAAASAPTGDDNDDPDPAVVRLLEAHALEASAGCFGLAPSSTSLSLSAADGGSLTPGATDLVAAARIQADIEAREAALVHSLLATTGRLQAGARGALGVARGAAALSRAAGLRSAFRALQALKRHPELLGVPEAELARRVLALKLALPGADVGALVTARPSLLLLGPAPVVSRVAREAAAQIGALMPGIPWQGKLAEGGTVYWSFSSVLDGSQGRARELAGEEEERRR